jgi:hypothetical protein
MVEDFAFTSRKTLYRVLARLKRRGLLVQARTKDGGRDATAWFAVVRDAVEQACGSLFPNPMPAPAGGGSMSDLNLASPDIDAHAPVSAWDAVAHGPRQGGQ